jgi:hypothetical protein
MSVYQKETVASTMVSRTKAIYVITEAATSTVNYSFSYIPQCNANEYVPKYSTAYNCYLITF